MARIHRDSRRQRPPEETENENGSQPKPKKKQERTTIGDIIKSRMAPIKKGTPQTNEETTVFLTNLIRLREDRYTVAQCADIFDVGESTIYKYMATQQYKELQVEMISGQKDIGHLLISEVIPDAVGILYDLMLHSTSDFVKYKAATELLDKAGFNVEREDAHTDSRDGIVKFMKDIKEARARDQQMQPPQNVTVQIIQSGNETNHPAVQGQIVESDPSQVIPPALQQYYATVLPGGKLPPAFATAPNGNLHSIGEDPDHNEEDVHPIHNVAIDPPDEAEEEWLHSDG